MKPKLSLSSFCLKNFKAVQDSKTIKFTPLTAFVGNNCSGKSSVIEALETLQTLVVHGIDKAMQPWHGFEHIWNKAFKKGVLKGYKAHPISFSFSGKTINKKIKALLEITAEPNYNKVNLRDVHK